MRLRTFYMPDEINKNLYTSGSEFETMDGIEYIGPYHRYVTNEIYTESTWNSISSKPLRTFTKTNTKKDITYLSLKKNLKTNFASVRSHSPVIQQSDYITGYINRYFLQKINELILIEVDINQYNDWKSGQIDPNAYIGVELTWYISGTPLYIQNKNKKQVEYAAKTIPGILLDLTNLNEFMQNTNIVITPDINE
jgi:hypothetical protein